MPGEPTISWMPTEHILNLAAVELDGADINDDYVDVIDVVLLVNLILN